MSINLLSKEAEKMKFTLYEKKKNLYFQRYPKSAEIGLNYFVTWRDIVD